MKTIKFFSALAIMIALFSVTGYCQKKENGKIYNEHPAIKVVDAFTKALMDGDTSSMGKLMTADFRSKNPVVTKPHDKGNSKAGYLRGARYNFENFEYRSMNPIKGSNPIAIEYANDPSKDNAVIVESWDLQKSMHKETGVKVETYLHRSFTITNDNKIREILNYGNPMVGNNITAANSERKNGIVYSEHKNINNLRKLIGAAENGDLAKMYSFYDPKATFSNSNSEDGKVQNLEAVKAAHTAFFEKFEMNGIEQDGFPDYVVYEQPNTGMLYSWWNFYFIRKSDRKEIKVPFHYAHEVNGEGKITSEIVYYNGNLLK